MERIYFDNAATTPLDPRVLEAMMPYLTTHFGNPSSIYSYGRESRLAIETARKKIAGILHANPGEIFFTSGGTESSNTAIIAAVRDLHCKKILTSAIEHHATMHTVEHLARTGEVSLEYIPLLPDGHIDIGALEQLLIGSPEKCLVTLMHANNEIGNITDIQTVGRLCEKYNAVFHSDTVQTVGHFPFNLHELPVHFITGAAHKFHGPKGTGILYVSDKIKISPLVHGGSQERNMRAGTENVAGIVGFARALELATEQYEEDSKYIRSLKEYMMSELQARIPSVSFNGDPSGQSLYTVLSVQLPRSDKSEMLLFNLDINNICASGGSACTSGADAGSHVIRGLGKHEDGVTVRFSFSRSNTKEEVDRVIGILQTIM